MSDRLLYTRTEAAQQLSINPRTLDRLIAGKHIMCRRIGKRVLVPHTELVKFSRRDTFNID